MKFTAGTLINNRYQLSKELGQGGFADVWLAQDTELDNHEVALKIFAAEKGLDDSGLGLFKKEFLNTRELHHPHLLVPSHFEVIEGTRVPFMVMPFCSGGSLAVKVDTGYAFSEKEILDILKQTCSGLELLHSKEIVHRDIKPGNVLIDKQGNYLLSDFGISGKMRATLTKATTRQSYLTPAYSPPERYGKNPEGTTAGDIFSLGVAVYELCTGELPWDGQGGVMLMKGAEVPSLPERYSKELAAMVERCMAKSTTDRPTASYLIKWAENSGTLGNDISHRDRPKPDLQKETKAIDIEVPSKNETILKPGAKIEKEFKPKETSQRSKSKIYVAIGLLVALVGLIILLFNWSNFSQSLSENQTELPVDTLYSADSSATTEVFDTTAAYDYDEDQKLREENENLNAELERQKRERRELALITPFTVESVLFKNGSNAEDLGAQEYADTFQKTEVRYIYTYLSYRAILEEERTFKIYVKIFNPDGSLKSFTDSPSGFTFGCDAYYYPSSSVLELSGYGNAGGGAFTEGTHKVEIWMNTRKIIGQGSFVVY